MKSIFLSLAFFVTCFCRAEFTDHLQKITGERIKSRSIKNIDFIYLINLDQRPEKLEKCATQLNSYNISFQRFPAIYGWDLSAGTLNDIGVKFSPGMLNDQWVIHFPMHGEGVPENDFLREECYGKTFFSRWMTPGAIGCTLSHLSILQDAYDAGYQTIWVMEDDILVERDPAQLTFLIEKLDQLVGKDGWDILYTDLDTSDAPLYSEINDFESDLKGDLWFFWRPDIDLSDRSHFAKRTILSEDFIKIGGRMRTHSMIIRRSGMKKILDFEKSHHIFIAYDHELATVPDIQMVSLRYNLVTHAPSLSDTYTSQFLQKSNNWDKYKQETLSELPSLLGWYEPMKAEKIMEFMRETQPKTCVEIGAFGGAMTFPIARTLLFLKQGTMAAIDAWDTSTAVEGLEDVKSIQCWKDINMDAIHQKFLELISKKMLGTCCVPIRTRSQDAAVLFADESIDFLYIDGNNSRSGSLKDAMLYLPKVKTGGFIWLNNADLLEKNQAVAYLMANCKWIKEKSIGINFTLFQKISDSKKLKVIDIISNFKLDDFFPQSRIERNTGLDLHLNRLSFSNAADAKKIIFLNPCWDEKQIATLPKEKLALFLWELNQHSNSPYFQHFSRIYTFHDDYVDNVKYFKFYYPFLTPMKSDLLAFKQRKFCTLVASNWTKDRREIIDFFALKPEGEFEYYGYQPCHNQKMYRGPIPGEPWSDEKVSALNKYRFCICFENSSGNGYITEKIFSCFAAGCIPIYLGAPNVLQYIPKECFIDYRDFKNNAELYQFLKAMTEEKYQQYVENIRIYLKSEKANLFSVEHFAETIQEAINH